MIHRSHRDRDFFHAPRRSLRLLLLVVLVPLLTGITAAPPARGDELSDALARQKALAAGIADQRKQVAKLNALQAGVRAETIDTKTALAGINADLGMVKRRIASLADQIAVIKGDYDDLVGRLADLDRQLVVIQGQEEQKATQLTQRKSVFADRLRAAYRAQRSSLIETVLAADSFTDVLTEVEYFIDFGEQDKVLAEQIVRDQATLAALRQSVSDSRIATESLRLETARQRTQMAGRIADLKVARATLAKVEAETARQLAVQRRAYERLATNKAAVAKAITQDQAAQKALERKVDDLVRQQYQRGNIPSAYNGTMAWPVGGTITQEFGCTGFLLEPTVGNCRGFHGGIDIAAPRWTPVRAAADGTVVFAGPNPYDPYPKAWIVIIAHAQNLRTWYAHVDNDRPPPVRPGQFVRQGEIIAYTGSTGRSTGYHTDWRIELNGTFVNPRLFL